MGPVSTQNTQPTHPIDVTDAKTRTKHSTASRQIRGSSLLLAGKMLSMGLNFAIQILIVRYLSKSTYGAFAYALSFVTLGQSIATFGLDRAITRFIPIYHEKQEYNKLFGTIALVVGTVVSVGTVMIALVYTFQSVIAQHLIRDEQAVALLLILIFMAPVEACDDLLEGLFAVFSSPRAILVRKHVLAPGLRLLVVLFLILGGSNVFFLAGGYLTASAIGVSLYVVMLFYTLRKQGLLAHFDLKNMNMPARELFAFTIPLLTSDLVFVLMSSSDAVLLGYFRNTAEVAAFRVVQPAAVMNQLVLTSFTLLFTPTAARLFARNDHEGINNLYWQTAVWTSIFSFPIFVVTFSLAHPITVLLYGQTYEQSSVILALLSLGYYFNAALGFNGLTLKVFGKLRFIVIINLLAAVLNVIINLLLIPRYGALGAAFGTCGTMIMHNILKQIGLTWGTGISMFQWRYSKVYVSIILGAVGLLLVQLFLAPNVFIGVVLAGIVSLIVLGLNRKALNVGETFPELLRFPVARWLFGE